MHSAVMIKTQVSKIGGFLRSIYSQTWASSPKITDTEPE
jgi:hypothetical protein